MKEKERRGNGGENGGFRRGKTDAIAEGPLLRDLEQGDQIRSRSRMKVSVVSKDQMVRQKGMEGKPWPAGEGAKEVIDEVIKQNGRKRRTLEQASQAGDVRPNLTLDKEARRVLIKEGLEDIEKVLRDAGFSTKTLPEKPAVNGIISSLDIKKSVVQGRMGPCEFLEDRQLVVHRLPSAEAGLSDAQEGIETFKVR